MPSSPQPTRSQRSIKLLVWLLQRGTATRAEAARYLGVSDRVAREDLHMLATVLPSVHTSGSGRDTCWIVDPAASINNLGILDRVSLLLGRDLASFLQGTALHGGLDRVGTDSSERVRVGSDRNLSRKFRALHEPARHYEDQTEVLDDLLDGLLRQRWVTLRYGMDAEDAVWQPTTRPLTLTIYRRALYLLASPDDATPVRRWSVSKIQDVQVGDAFEYPVDWDPDAELAGWFGIYTAQRLDDVIIEFEPEVAHYVWLRQWSDHQSLIPRIDGGVRLEMRSGGPELVRWVLEWGDKAQVISPEWLRADVIAELSGALSQYDREQP